MTHIQMHDDYTQTTRYSGILNDKYPFTIDCDYNSIAGNYEIKEVVWQHDKPKKNMNKSETLIKDFVNKWLFGKPKEETE